MKATLYIRLIACFITILTLTSCGWENFMKFGYGQFNTEDGTPERRAYDQGQNFQVIYLYTKKPTLRSRLLNSFKALKMLGDKPHIRQCRHLDVLAQADFLNTESSAGRIE